MIRLPGAVPWLPGALLLGLCLPAWWLDRTALLAAWLAGWCFAAGIVMGGLANVWLHTLTGGAWGDAIRPRLLGLGRLMPWLALLFLPILAGLQDLYPWAAGRGLQPWAGELTAPAFKAAWLQPSGFALRAVAILALWCFLAWRSRRPHSGPFAAVALVAYSFSVGVAAVDWIMSLLPVWYSSSFGLVVAIGQVLAGMAFAIALAARDHAEPRLLRDLGNLLLAYVLTWAYLAFTQFLIVWSENLPHEISWYVVRLQTGWLWAGVLLAVFHFALPLLILLFRQAKESARWAARLALGLLAVHALDCWWLVLPSVAGRASSPHLLGLAVLATLGLAALGWGLLPASGGARRHA